MKTRTTRYFVRVKQAPGAGYSFCESDYSKFFKRLSAKDAGKLRGLVYGPEQCREHIAELRRFVYDGKKIHKDQTFEIVRRVTTETVIKTVKP